jgi:Domain of unknown function (DUF6265)
VVLKQPLQKRVALLVLIAATLAAAGTFTSGPSAARARVNNPQATLRDFEWFAGRWTGTSDGHPTEEICSHSGAAMIVCVFRVVDDNPPMLEIITIRETADGIEERVRHTLPALDTWDGAAALVLRLQSLDDHEMVFANVDEKSVAKRVIVTHDGTDAMTSRVEVLTPQGKTIYLEAKSSRAK